MKKCLLLCLMLLLTASEVRAQDDNSPATPVKPAPFQQVPYVRDVPKAVRQTMPQGTKTLFWGRFTPKNNKCPICVHLFELWQGEEERIKNDSLRKSGIIHCALDIFDGTSTSHLKRINRIFFSSIIYKRFLTLYDVKFYWLNAQAHTQPMLVIQNCVKGEYGPLGDENFVVLDSGWPDEATIDTFSYGGWHGSTTSGETNSVYVNADGKTFIKAFASPTTSELSPEELRLNYHATFEWREGGFFPISTMGKFTRNNIGFSGWDRVPRPN